MVFEASRKFFFIGYRNLKGPDEEYGIYLKDALEKKKMIDSFYKSDLYKTFLENGYAADEPADLNKSGRMSFKKNDNKRVKINYVNIIFPDEKNWEEFHIQIEGVYEMGFSNGRIQEGYKAMIVLGDEIRNMFTDKLSKKPQIPMMDKE